MLTLSIKERMEELYYYYSKWLSNIQTCEVMELIFLLLYSYYSLLEQSGYDNSLLVEMNFDDNKVLKLELVLLIIVLVCRIIC
jgi:hypothetical protein